MSWFELDDFSRRMILRKTREIEEDEKGMGETPPQWGRGDIAHFLIWQRLPGVDVRTLTGEEWEFFYGLADEWLTWREATA